MDSFYDAPRKAPAPVASGRILPSTLVPEVSLLCNEQTNQKYGGNLPYSGWTSNQLMNKENMGYNRMSAPQNTSQILKKQVRFESPTIQQRPSLTYEPIQVKSVSPKFPNNLDLRENFKATKVGNMGETTSSDMGLMSENKSSNMGGTNGKTFDQIYMANVPNRHLDLSIIDPPHRPISNMPKCKNDEQIALNVKEKNDPPKTYKEFLESQKNKEETTGDFNIYSYFEAKNSPHSDKIKNVNERKTPKSKNILSPTVSDQQTPPNIKNDTRPLFNKNDLTSPIIKNDVRRMFNKSDDNLQCFSRSPKCTENYVPNTNRNFNEHCNTIERQKDSPNFINSEAYPIKKSVPSIVQPNYTTPKKCDAASQIQMNYHNTEKFVPIVKRNSTNMNSEYDEPNDYMPSMQQNYKPPQKCDNSTQTSIIVNKQQETVKKDGEPTIKDLLKIISQQNEQLILLQKQVSSFMEREHALKQLEPVPPQAQNYVTSTQHENIPQGMNKRGIPKFSMMTSFEVSFRRPNKHQYVNHGPKLTEVTETESTDENEKKCEDTSLHFKEPLEVRETCPSPEPSVRINDFEEYDDSDDEESATSEIGATFYQNLMSQVNNVLKRAQIQTKENLADVRSEALKGKKMQKVREATLKHLKNIGVTLPPGAEESSSSQSEECNDTEISFAVKQLLMKYLPDEHLAKVTYKQTGSGPVNGGATGPALLSNRPEFSIATVQYLQKYNLIGNKDKQTLEPKSRLTKLQSGGNGKILDISALKKQPKLL
ncbi:uncharacterized protein LOC109598265 isoform X2 [Aethina tumida]|uniref:uncharacterized protein LOC109598265 isoform X2 n=1 Tax=Aethina tumida TaxID=116153 RepID=UPI002148DAA1|nr:uncharacterized protein LOC109598265 isoform X2 [Aethina tumida]